MYSGDPEIRPLMGLTESGPILESFRFVKPDNFEWRDTNLSVNSSSKSLIYVTFQREFKFKKKIQIQNAFIGRTKRSSSIILHSKIHHVVIKTEYLLVLYALKILKIIKLCKEKNTEKINANDCEKKN